MNDFNARDLFAGLAMVGLMATSKKVSDKRGHTVTGQDGFAELAYDMADAMILEKEKRDGGQEKNEG
jgi:hypothetical protein